MSQLKSKKNKKWSDYLWISSLIYLFLGLFNILFAWLGLFCFFIPIILSVIKGNKSYCHHYCGRGQLFELLGKKLKLSPSRPCPAFLKSKAFRYGFLAFFMTMFGGMLYSTYLVFTSSQTLREVVTLLWTFKLPWHFAYPVTVSPWVAQFAFGFYSIMLTSTLLGFITLLLFKPRTWCVYCPMGTMTQLICKAKTHH